MSYTALDWPPRYCSSIWWQKLIRSCFCSCVSWWCIQRDKTLLTLSESWRMELRAADPILSSYCNCRQVMCGSSLMSCLHLSVVSSVLAVDGLPSLSESSNDILPQRNSRYQFWMVHCVGQLSPNTPAISVSSWQVSFKVVVNYSSKIMPLKLHHAHVCTEWLQ